MYCITTDNNSNLFTIIGTSSKKPCSAYLFIKLSLVNI